MNCDNTNDSELFSSGKSVTCSEPSEEEEMIFKNSRCKISKTEMDLQPCNLKNSKAQNFVNADHQDDSVMGNNSNFIEGNTGGTNVQITNPYEIIYVNPSRGEINLTLMPAAPGTKISFKDVTLFSSSGSSYNVNIKVPQGTLIEQQSTSGFSGLTAVDGGTYVLDTSSGSVTLRYTNLFGHQAWIIENQFKGNPRLLTRAGVKFHPADNKVRFSMFGKK